MSGLLFVSFRRLRAPLVYLIVVLSISTAGLSLIPGVDAEGQPWRPNLFESFYFVTYTATTIGFGELPYTFTNLQRLWVTAIIYLSVVGWAYLLGSLLGLVQDKGFRAAVITGRFARSVGTLREPFFLLCGLGETGFTVARTIDRLGYRLVALDSDETRVLELDLADFRGDPLALSADATSPETLAMAGLYKPECLGVLALMPDDRANLAIAVAAQLLHPGLRTIARAHTPEAMDSLHTAGVGEVINPYREFAERLAVAMRAPDTFRLLTWLTGTLGTPLQPRVPTPPGHWIVCGYGRFGGEVVRAITRGGFDVTIIDPDEPPVPGIQVVQGLGTDTPVLHKAGVVQAEGIVAGSDDDIANLAMAMAARKLNPTIFVILRQNRTRNAELFRAFSPDMTMVPSEIIANECLARLAARHLSRFLAITYARDNHWAETLTTRLERVIGTGSPELWSCTINADEAPGLLASASHAAQSLTLRDLTRDIADRDRPMRCTALLLVRDGADAELPPDEMKLLPGDEVLFAGREQARRMMLQTLRNSNTADYVLTGRDRSGTLLGRSLARVADRQAGGDEHHPRGRGQGRRRSPL